MVETSSVLAPLELFYEPFPSFDANYEIFNLSLRNEAGEIGDARLLLNHQHKTAELSQPHVAIRGEGYGTKIYLLAAQFAAERGYSLRSSSKLNKHSSAVWERLVAQKLATRDQAGFCITKAENPDIIGNIAVHCTATVNGVETVLDT